MAERKVSVNAVWPCLKAKPPATPHSFKQAQCDPNGLSKLWRQCLALLVGVATGHRSRRRCAELRKRLLAFLGVAAASPDLG